jgi:hypothetical protein
VPVCWNNTKRIERAYRIEAARRAVREGRTQTLLGLLPCIAFPMPHSWRTKSTLCGLDNDSGADALAVKPDYKVRDAGYIATSPSKC